MVGRRVRSKTFDNIQDAIEYRMEMEEKLDIKRDHRKSPGALLANIDIEEARKGQIEEMKQRAQNLKSARVAGQYHGVNILTEDGTKAVVDSSGNMLPAHFQRTGVRQYKNPITNNQSDYLRRLFDNGTVLFPQKAKRIELGKQLNMRPALVGKTFGNFRHYHKEQAKRLKKSRDKKYRQHMKDYFQVHGWPTAISTRWEPPKSVKQLFEEWNVSEIRRQAQSLLDEWRRLFTAGAGAKGSESEASEEDRKPSPV